MKTQLATLLVAAMATLLFPSGAQACAYSGGTYEGSFQGKKMIFVFDKDCTQVAASFEGQTPETSPAEIRGKRVVVETQQLVITFAGNGKRLSVQAPGGGFLSSKLKRVK